MDDKLKITKKTKTTKKGEDGHKVFSIRIKDELVEKLDEIAIQTDRSRNDVIKILLTYAVDRCEVIDKNKPEDNNNTPMPTPPQDTPPLRRIQRQMPS